MSNTTAQDPIPLQQYAAAKAGTALLLPGLTYELRAFYEGRPHAVACCDDPIQVALELAAAGPHGVEVYSTLNGVTPEFAGRNPPNVFRPAVGGGSAGDRDIARRTQLLVDIEPERSSGTGTTDAQLAAARRLADRVSDDLAARGWTRFGLVCSGNGYHLRYRVDLPPDDHGLVHRTLNGLAATYEGVEHGVKIDTSVHDAARLVRMPGTRNRKGHGGQDAPHRLCELVHVDPNATVVTGERLEAVAVSPEPDPCVPRAVLAVRTGGRFDLGRFMAECLPNAEGPVPYHGGRKWVLPVCPWNPAHDNAAAFVIERSDGTRQAGCHHDGCSQNKWTDLRALFDPAYAARREREERLRELPPAIARRLARRRTRRAFNQPKDGLRKST